MGYSMRMLGTCRMSGVANSLFLFMVVTVVVMLIVLSWAFMNYTIIELSVLFMMAVSSIRRASSARCCCARINVMAVMSNLYIVYSSVVRVLELVQVLGRNFLGQVMLPKILRALCGVSVY